VPVLRAGDDEMTPITTVGERGKDAVVMEIAEPFPGVHVARIVERDHGRTPRGFRFTASNGAHIRSVSGSSTMQDWLEVVGIDDNMDYPFLLDTADRDRVVAAVTELNRSLRRKRKVQVEAWMNVNRNLDKTGIYFSKEAADHVGGPRRIACVRLTGEYEVDE
jgi:hypothetical protein